MYIKFFELQRDFTNIFSFVCAYVKLWKATTSFVMFVRPYVRLSVRLEQIGCHCTDFHEIWYLSIFLNSVGIIQI
jgi:hypothetical protein